MLARLTLPPSPAVLAAVVLAFMLPGLAGHDLWKSYDAINIGIAHEMANSGDLVVPRLAGMLWLNTPPLYHWLAAGFGKTFKLFTEFHSGARLASGALMLAAFYLIYLAGRATPAKEDAHSIGAAALLILLGSIGLIVHAHEALPELASLAALCAALATLPHAQRRPLAAGLLFGLSLGLALLSADWIAPLALALAVGVAHVVSADWRNRSGAVFLLTGLAVAAAIGGAWPAALWAKSPQLFHEWWGSMWQPEGGFVANLRYFLSTASWFAWPAWPLALWAVWSLRRRLREPALLAPLTASLLILAGISFWGPQQDVKLIPPLAPLALLAVQSLPRLRRGASAALDWFGAITFAFFTALVWLGYVAMMTGVPPRVAANLARQAPGFVPSFEVLPFLFAVVLLAGWIYAVFFTLHSPMRSVARWAAGIVLLWGSFAVLWMPWADYQKTYRSVALQLRSKMPVDAGCLAQRSLGIAQAAALDYHAGIRAQPYDVVKPQACPLLLVQGSPQHEFDAPGRGWTKLADVGRPGDRSERYRLYQFQK